MYQVRCSNDSISSISDAFQASCEAGSVPGVVAGQAVHTAAHCVVVKVTQGAGSAWGFVRGFFDGVVRG